MSDADVKYERDGVRARAGQKKEGAGPGISRSGGKRMRRLGVISGGTFVPAAGGQQQTQTQTKATGADGARAYVGNRDAGVRDASYTGGGQTIRLDDGNMAQLQVVVAAVQRAKQMVAHALSQLGSATAPRVVSALNANFHTTDARAITNVRSYLTAIQSGLNGDIGFEVEEADGTTRAYVYRLWSDIHLLPAWFADGDADNRARTVIHECSHKFNGTDDEAYHWQASFATLDPKDALDNADSYAWFCMDLR